MKTMQNFISDLHIIRDKHFKEMISEYKNKYANTSYWNGPELKIENIVDCSILLTKDKKVFQFILITSQKLLTFPIYYISQDIIM